MKLRPAAILALTLAIFLGAAGFSRSSRAQTPPQKITDIQRGQAEAMLLDVREAVKKNYYDPAFHGLDIEARYKTYKERLIKAETLGDAFRTIAAFLAGLDDSHTFFLPPRRSYRVDYGYNMQLVGDDCFITGVRPDTDAAKKLHPGDQVQLLGTYSVNRKDLWQLQYFLNSLAPSPATDLTLKDPTGNIRKEQVLTKMIQRQKIQDLSFGENDNDLYKLILESEEERHFYRNRYAEIEDVMIWKMPIFISDDGEIDHMIGLARKHKTLILDLRDNPGGSVDTLDHLIGSFFDHDVKVASVVSRKGQKPQMAKSQGKGIFTGKLIVLVDSSSASAAEIFARVMQLEHRGTVLGDHSSGSVMESIHYPYSYGADIQVYYGVSVTIADLIMADGKSLEKLGVTPDEIILPTGAQIAAGHDPVLARAAELAGIHLDPITAGKLFPYEWAPM